MSTGSSLGAIVATLGMLACAEANPVAIGGGGQGGNAEETGGGGSSAQAGGQSGGAAPTSAVVVNELSLEADWVELYNQSDFPVDVDGLLLADDDGAGEPKLSDAIELPKGTTLAAHGYLFILAKQNVDPGKQDPETMCDPGPSPCFYAPFGLAADGDVVYLLDGDTVMDQLATEGQSPSASQSVCRAGDGAGAIAVCTPTPGAANQL